MNEAADSIEVEVAYALPERQTIIAMTVTPGTTALEAVHRSGILTQFPDIDPASLAIGIFSRPLDGSVNPSPQEYILQPRDRVEIYRPLLIDPKEARLARAAKAARDAANVKLRGSES